MTHYSFCPLERQVKRVSFKLTYEVFQFHSISGDTFLVSGNYTEIPHEKALVSKQSLIDINNYVLWHGLKHTLFLVQS